MANSGAIPREPRVEHPARGGETIASHAFTLEDQAGFASLSGDFNPLHSDRLVARRTMFGDAIVSGVHGLV